MFDSDFNFDLSLIANSAIKVVIILLVALVLVLVLKKLIPKIIQARIPKIRKEDPEQLAKRSDTLARVVTRFFIIVV